jgi:hypothetical protein
LKIFQFIFFTVYRVCGAVIGGNFTAIGEYSNTVKKSAEMSDGFPTRRRERVKPEKKLFCVSTILAQQEQQAHDVLSGKKLKKRRKKSCQTSPEPSFMSTM